MTWETAIWVAIISGAVSLNGYVGRHVGSRAENRAATVSEREALVSERAEDRALMADLRKRVDELSGQVRDLTQEVTDMRVERGDHLIWRMHGVTYIITLRDQVRSLGGEPAAIPPVLREEVLDPDPAPDTD